MDPEFVNLTPENLADEHLSCIIRVRKPHPGVEAKRHWLADRLREGHVFRKLQVKDPVFIEYAPLETAWVPVLGDNYLYVYCLWAYGAGKGKGYGRALMEYCLADARVQGKSGVCLLGAKKQKAWLTDQAFGYHVPQEDPQEIGALQTRQLTVSCASSSPFPLRRPSLSSYGSPRLAPSASRKPSIPNRESIARSSWCSTCLPMR